MKALQHQYDGYVDPDNHIQADRHKNENILYNVNTSFYFD